MENTKCEMQKSIFCRFSKFLAGVLIITFCSSVAFSQNNAKNCYSDSELLASELEQLEQAVPCTWLGLAFLEGLNQRKHLPTTDFNYYVMPGPKIDGEFIYYIQFREHLKKIEKNPNEKFDADSFAFLLGSLSVLPENDDARKTLYGAYPLIYFFKSNKEKMKMGGQAIFRSLELMEFDKKLSNTTEIECFIKVDIPTFSVVRILESVAFQECLKHKP